MATELRTRQEIEGRLNNLYWNSARTVDEILEDLAVSRNFLYSSIDPIPTGSLCPICTGMLVFTNRSSRATGNGTCESCGMESEVVDPEAEVERDVSGFGFSSNGNGRLDRLQDDLAGVETRRAALIGGAAAMGVLVGTMVIRNIRG